MNFTKSQTIYMQIANHLLEQILTEAMQPGDKVPSVRELAAMTEVNPNTVMRTFTYLQEQDIIFNKRGIGYFVADDAYEKTKAMRKETFIKQYLPEFYKTMKLLKMDFKDLEAIYKQQSNGHTTNGTNHQSNGNSTND